jgi:hypothetical protein
MDQSLPVDAYSGHGGAVAAFLCLAVAMRPGREIARFVPERHRFRGDRVFCFHGCGRLLAIGRAANTRRSRTCAWSPKRSRAAQRSESKSTRPARRSRDAPGSDGTGVHGLAPGCSSACFRRSASEAAVLRWTALEAGGSPRPGRPAGAACDHVDGERNVKRCRERLGDALRGLAPSARRPLGPGRIPL